MTKKKTSTEYTVLWWIGWITLTILTFFVSCYFWTGFIAKYVGTMSQKGVPLIWVAAVFGSWLILLVPLIIVMYSKVDKAYEDARMSRESNQYEKMVASLKFKSILAPDEDRRLSVHLVQKIKKIPATLKDGHLVTAILKSGQKIPFVFIYKRSEVLGVYDRTSFDFKASDIADIEPADLDRLPAFETKKWLRLDGAGLGA